MNKKITSMKFLALVFLTSVLLTGSIYAASVKAQTQDSVYVYDTIGGTISAGGTALTGNSTYSYNNGTAVTFTANPGSGFKFLAWEYVSATGANTSTDNPFVYTIVSASCAIQAMFTPTTNATASSSSGGTSTVDLLSSIGGTTEPAEGTYTNYTIGTVYNFNAVAGTGFKFLYWIVATSAGANVYTTSTLALNLTSSTCALQAMWIPTSSTVSLPTIIDEFSTAAAITLVAVLAVSVIGTYAYTRKTKK